MCHPLDTEVVSKIGLSNEATLVSLPSKVTEEMLCQEKGTNEQARIVLREGLGQRAKSKKYPNRDVCEHLLDESWLARQSWA